MTRSSTNIWKHFLLLSVGLLVYAFILVRTVADVYSLVTEPAAGFQPRYSQSDSSIIIKSVDANRPAALAGIEPGDTLLSINGRRISGVGQLGEAWNSLRIGKPASVTVRRNGQIIELTLVPSRRGAVYLWQSVLGLLPISLFAYFLCLIGTFVYLKRLNDRSAVVFYLLALTFAAAMRNAITAGSSLLSFLPDWWSYLSLPAWPLAIGLFLHFHLLFPQTSKVLRRHPRLTLAAVYAPLSLLIPFLLLRNAHPGLANRILDVGWGIWLTINFSIAVCLLGISRRRAPEPLQRKQAQIMYWGAIVGLVPSLSYGFLPVLFWKTALPYANLTLLTLLVWPISIAYAIVRYRFLDVELIVRKGLAYVLLSGFVIGLYLLLVVAAGRLVLLLTGSGSQLFTIFATVVIAVLFNPAKNRIQSFVDRRFYRRHFSYREDVRKLSHQLVRVLDLGELFRLLVNHLGESMGITPVAIFWRGHSGDVFVLRTSRGLDPGPQELPPDDEVTKRLQTTLQLVDVAALERNLALSGRQLPPIWSAMQAEICLPLLADGNLTGVLVLGRKESGEAYTASDIDLLGTVNDQINIALENALLGEELREQERIRKELEVARRIQLTSLPSADPQVPGLEISGISLPAYEVGGDYYDYLFLDGDRFGVVVGDVSGKSTSAALYMAKIQGIVQSLAPILSSPVDLLLRINALAHAGLDRRSFITMVLGIFEPQPRRLTLLRAGHLPVLHYSAEQNRCRHLLPKGLGLGLDAGPLFERQLQPLQTTYKSGDVLVFFSDGVTEVMDDQGELFDIEGVEKVVSQAAEQSASGVREAVIEAARNHGNGRPLSDDLTVVVIKATEP